MADTPFAPIYSNVIAYNIQSVKIIADTRGYQPLPMIAAHIQKRSRQNPLKFDGTAWYLSRFAFSERTGALTLSVGTGKYSQYRWTNLDPEIRTQWPSPDLWFNALCIGALVITEDQKMFFERRPEDAYLSSGKIGIACGHPSDITDPPSTAVLDRALRSILERETKTKLCDAASQPLILIKEEPRSAYDLLFVVSVAATSEEIRRNRTEGSHFNNMGPEDIAEFLKSENNMSPPVFPALTFWGRRQYGENWFQQFCKVKT